MDQKIKKILIDAGAAKGISRDEVLILLVLGNDEMFAAFLENIKNSLSKKDFKDAKLFFEIQKKKVSEAQKKYAATLKAAREKSEKDFLDAEIAKMSPAEQKKLNDELTFLFSQQ